MRTTVHTVLLGALIGGAIVLIVLIALRIITPWEGWVYPNKHDLTRDIALGRFATLDACRTAATSLLATFGLRERGDYECGYACDDGTRLRGIKICSTTAR